MPLYQRLCNEQKAYDQVVIQGMISREDNLLTMPAERVNAILVAFNEGRTLEEAQRLAEDFLGVLGSVRAAFIYSATMADDGRLTDKTAYTVQINQPERSLDMECLETCLDAIHLQKVDSAFLSPSKRTNGQKCPK